MSALVQPVLSGFDSVSLADLQRVSLLDRTDTKFVLSIPQLTSILANVADSYRILDIGGVRLHRYHTLYFDTPRLDLYRQHHANHAGRHKVRSRIYVDSGLAFLEVKQKTNKGRTIKHRLPVPALLTELTRDASAFVADHVSIDCGDLQPALANDFLRMTLVNVALTERVTVDLGVCFSTDDAATAALPNIAIAEVKQAGVDRTAGFVRQLRAARVQPVSVSKYCTGVALLRPAVKHNAFNPKLRMLRKLMHSGAH